MSLDGGGGIWDFLGNLGAGLGGTLAAVWDAIAGLATTLVWFAHTIIDILRKLWNLLGDLFKRIGNFFRHLWNNFFKRIFPDLMNAIRKVHTWLELHLRPIINWLVKARQWYDRMFRMYLKPMLNMIQHVRQYLQILRLLGVKWAGALDAKLGKFEADIAGLYYSHASAREHRPPHGVFLPVARQGHRWWTRPHSVPVRRLESS
jgi:hypothetical protein